MGQRQGSVEKMAMNDSGRSFWSGKKVFLTGHTGFKGAWLALWLEMLGARVYGYSLAPAESSLYRDANLAGRFGEAFADIRDGALLKEKMSGFGPDVAFHLAAQPLVYASYREPVETCETNIMGTVNFLEAVRTAPSVRSAVVVTTDKCYRDMDWDWGYRETDALGGADPYSSSKACAELLCGAWRSSFFAESGALIATARAGNVIGGGDWAENRLIPDAVRAFAKGETLEIRSPEAVRPWQHVLEPLAGYMALAKRLYEGDGECARAWNFGPSTEDSRSVRAVVTRLTELWGGGASYRVSDGRKLHESRFLRLDSSLAARRLGWRPSLGLGEALIRTVEWYKRVSRGASALAVTQEQIAARRDDSEEDILE